MVTNFFNKYKIVIVLILVILLCAAYAQTYYSEHFQSSSIPNELTLPNAKSSAYFPYISDFVYTNLATSKTTFSEDQQKRIMHFLPTYADGICNLTSMAGSCSNYYINNISYSDPYDFHSQIACKNIESTVGLDKSQCEVRILNNIYTLRKKCIRFTTEQSSPGIFVNSVTSINNSYIVNVVTKSNDIDMFALLRPNMISFGNFGLYKIEPLMTSNLFSSYSSSNTSNTFIITPYSETSPILKIYPEIKNSFVSLTNTKVWNILATIYFLNYENKVYLGGNQYYNTFNFVVDHNYLKQRNSESTRTFTETITFNTHATNPSLLTNLIYNFNVTPSLIGSTTIRPFFKVTLNHSGSSSSSITIPVHADFTDLINTYLKYQPTDPKHLFNNNYISWHIAVVCTLDLIIILAMFRDFTTGQVKFFMTQQQISDSGVIVYLQYLGNSEGKILDSQSIPKPVNLLLLNNHYQYFNNVCPNTSVPNLAMVAKNLGYL